LARAVVPPPRLRAFPLAFDAADAPGAEQAGGAFAAAWVGAFVTRIDAAGHALLTVADDTQTGFGSEKGNKGNRPVDMRPKSLPAQRKSGYWER
jgi:hypothetical protein